MKLIIEIPCNDGVEMEINLNKAIADFSETLLKKGFSEMELVAYNETVKSELVYKLTLLNKIYGLRPCDCKDAVDTSRLEEQGICNNDESITVIPNYVLLKMGHTEIKIGMNRFKLFAEWYLSEQDVKHNR